MTCCSGFNHTVTVSDNGKVYSFGLNRSGQLGLSKQDNISVPRHISSLPKIKMWFPVVIILRFVLITKDICGHLEITWVVN